MRPIEIVGIINVTPDSFSDGGHYLQPKEAISQAEKLLASGASIIEIGGDSTRPGSICVGAKEEWRRVGEVVLEVSKLCRVSIDTHHSEVAIRALNQGAWMINDVFGGQDAEMLRVVKEHNSRITLMASRLTLPHIFEKSYKKPILEATITFLNEAVSRAKSSGLNDDQIILDTGMGAFISDDPNDSWNVIKSYQQFNIGYPLLLGVSRKGFLRAKGESHITDRDLSSFCSAMEAYKAANFEAPRYLRVHNVALHCSLLQTVSESTGFELSASLVGPDSVVSDTVVPESVLDTLSEVG